MGKGIQPFSPVVKDFPWRTGTSMPRNQKIKPPRTLISRAGTAHTLPCCGTTVYGPQGVIREQ